MKQMVLITVMTCSTCALAWGSAHNAVAKLCGEYMPAEVKAFLGDWNNRLEEWCHYPDMQVVDGKRRFLVKEDMRGHIGEDAELFIKWGFDKGDWLHRHTGRAVSFANLQRAFREGKPKLAAFCISELSHSLSDQGALNHGPILQFTTYSCFKGVDYGWKHNGEFTTSNQVVAQGLEKRLSNYCAKTLSKDCAEAMYEVVMDCYRQSEIAAEEEVNVAFGTKEEHDAAMTRVVAAQIESILDAVQTAWTLRGEKFEVTQELLNGIYPREEIRRRRGNPRTQAVYKGIFETSLNPAKPKATVGIVCEPFGSFHVRVLSYVGKMLVAASARTLRDDGYAVWGISFWEIEKVGLPSPKDVQVIMISLGNCTGMSAAQVEAFKKYRAAGGLLFVMGGSDTKNITGLRDLLQMRTNAEVPVSSKWALDDVGDWGNMRIVMTEAMKKTGTDPIGFVRNPNFDGFCKPCCMWSLKDSVEMKPLARLAHDGKSFTVGGIVRGVCWMPEYLFLPFLFSQDKTVDWGDMRLDSFASKVLTDAFAVLVQSTYKSEAEKANFICAAVKGTPSETEDPRGILVNKPDYVVFVPKQPRAKDKRNPAKPGDTYNDHFHVISNPSNGMLYAFWTQASYEADIDQHIAFSRSADKGLTWTDPVILAGSPNKVTPALLASWQQPMLSKSGRLYCLWNQQTTSQGPHCGMMFGSYSDNDGTTWSAPKFVPFTVRMDADPADERIPPSWCNWQRPLRLGENGKYFVGCSRHGKASYDDRFGCKIEFWEFQNIDDNPKVEDIKLKYFSTNKDSLSASKLEKTGGFRANEPAIEEAAPVKLPDGRLFALMRSSVGSPVWVQSRDGGRTWSEPKLLKDAEGKPYLHPRSPCPMYDWKGSEAASGQYFALVHQTFNFNEPTGNSYQHRGPLYLIAGTFDPEGEQPIKFKKPKLFAPRKWGNSFYTSYCIVDGKGVLWFNDMKFYLCGRVIGPEWFE